MRVYHSSQTSINFSFVMFMSDTLYFTFKISNFLLSWEINLAYSFRLSSECSSQLNNTRRHLQLLPIFSLKFDSSAEQAIEGDLTSYRRCGLIVQRMPEVLLFFFLQFWAQSIIPTPSQHLKTNPKKYLSLCITVG